MSATENTPTEPNEASTAATTLTNTASTTPDPAIEGMAEPATAQTVPLDEIPAGIQASDAAARPANKVAGPRIRWGAVAWGLIAGLIAALTLAVTRTADGRAGFALWFGQLTPGGIWLIVVLALGGILLLLGLLSAIRRLQRR